jgi:hypothetical protein
MLKRIHDHLATEDTEFTEEKMQNENVQFKLKNADCHSSFCILHLIFCIKQSHFILCELCDLCGKLKLFWNWNR